MALPHGLDASGIGSGALQRGTVSCHRTDFYATVLACCFCHSPSSHLGCRVLLSLNA